MIYFRLARIYLPGDRCILQRHLPLGPQSAGSRLGRIKLAESNRACRGPASITRNKLSRVAARRREKTKRSKHHRFNPFNPSVVPRVSSNFSIPSRDLSIDFKLSTRSSRTISYISRCESNRLLPTEANVRSVQLMQCINVEFNQTVESIEWQTTNETTISYHWCASILRSARRTGARCVQSRPRELCENCQADPTIPLHVAR